MSIINRKISIKYQTPKHLMKFYLLSLLPESESSKISRHGYDYHCSHARHGHHGHRDRQENQEIQDRQI